jgi:cytochrome c556
MRPYRWVLIAGLLAMAAACDKPAAPPPAATASAPSLPDMPTVPADATVKDIMAAMVDPSGDFMFESVQDIADDRGITRKQPRTDADWALVRHHIEVLNRGADLLAVPGRKAARAEERAAFPAVELQPEEVDHLLATERPDFLRRIGVFKAAVADLAKAAEAKDAEALLTSLNGLDKGCESCHLHYWYPKDQRARQAAKEEGVVD